MDKRRTDCSALLGKPVWPSSLTQPQDGPAPTALFFYFTVKTWLYALHLRFCCASLNNHTGTDSVLYWSPHPSTFMAIQISQTKLSRLLQSSFPNVASILFFFFASFVSLFCLPRHRMTLPLIWFGKLILSTTSRKVRARAAQESQGLVLS